MTGSRIITAAASLPRDTSGVLYLERVYIGGGAGSGKTTLAMQLEAAFGIEHCDVDRGQRPGDLLGGRWVVEGAHIFAMEQYVEAADLVIWLDLPMRVCVRRIATRHVRLSIKGENRHPGVRNLIRFLSSQRRYYKEAAREPTGPTDWDALTRAATANLFSPRITRVVHLRTPKAVRTWSTEVISRRQQLNAHPGRS